MKEAETLKSQREKLSKDVSSRSAILSEADRTSMEVDALEAEVERQRERLTALQVRSTTLGRSCHKAEAENASLATDLDLLVSERNQAERLAIKVGKELAEVEDRVGTTKKEDKVLSQRLMQYRTELAAVSEIQHTVIEMKHQASSLKDDLQKRRQDEVALIDDIEAVKESLAEEEMVHDALISDLAVQQEELRKLRQRSALTEKASTVSAFFRDARALTQKAIIAAQSTKLRQQYSRADTAISAASDIGSDDRGFSALEDSSLGMMKGPTPRTAGTGAPAASSSFLASQSNSPPRANPERHSSSASSSEHKRAKTIHSIMSQIQRLDFQEAQLVEEGQQLLTSE